MFSSSEISLCLNSINESFEKDKADLQIHILYYGFIVQHLKMIPATDGAFKYVFIIINIITITIYTSKSYRLASCQTYTLSSIFLTLLVASVML